MDILELIQKRRSIRHYTKDELSDELINKVLDAGRWAPSGLNNQPWRFLVIKDKKRKNALAKFTKYSAIIKEAPVLICVFFDTGSSYNQVKDLMAVGACIQNMLLAAYGLELGAVWLGEILNQKLEVQDYLKVDSDYEFLAAVALGHPDEEIGLGCRKELKDLVL